MSGIGSSGPEPREDLTRLTVNLTRPARAALDKAVALHGDTNTDVVNYALMLYVQVVDIAANHEGSYWVQCPQFDDMGDVWLLVARQRPKRRRWSLW